MDILDKQIAPPKSWEKFEDLICALFASVWANPLTQKNGRNGQPQHGVDVYGEPAGEAGTLIGIQCKGKDAGYHSKPTQKEFDAELAKAEAFKPSLSKWIFVTSAPNDASLQEHVRGVSNARVESGKFPVDILGWRSLHGLLARHPSVFRQFYPEQFSSLPDEIALLAQANSSALHSIDDTLNHGGTGLTLLRPDYWKATIHALQEHSVVRLTGDGGVGKSGIIKRLAATFHGALLVVKDNRTVASSLQHQLAQLGIYSDAPTLLRELAQGRPALCIVDGADRLLMSERRGVVVDLFRAILNADASKHWRIITTTRSYRQRDLVSAALAEAGFANHGIDINIGVIDDDDAAMLSTTFPAFSHLLSRSDLAGQNRSLFLLRELLRRHDAPSQRPTEIDIAGAWADADLYAPTITATRSKALSELGNWLLRYPWQLPGKAEFEPTGLQTLIEEGTVLVVPNRDAVTVVHDVHEDWLLARSLHRNRHQLLTILHAANQPLWWHRSLRLAAQIVLNSGDVEGWRSLIASVEAESVLDPSWSRTLIMAPLYSDRPAEIMPACEAALLRDDARLLERMIDTLVLSETRINESLFSALSHLERNQRYAIASYLREPVYRSWTPFLRWSVPSWRGLPPRLIPRLSEIALIFTRATSHIANGLSQSIAVIACEWLIEIEDSEYPESWADRRRPFNSELADNDHWDNVESRLRETLVHSVASAREVVERYLDRLARGPHMHHGRRKILEYPGRIPEFLPASWVNMCLAEFVPPRPRVRSTPDDPIPYELFSWHEDHHAGINENLRFFPSSPLRGGFNQLFKTNEREALRLFHRLEIRASVRWRWHSRCHDRRRPIPLLLNANSGRINLWGDENVYRWSRGVLGSHVLGSAYLALDEWIHNEAASGRPIGELLSLVLRNNGLVATAALCIAVICDHINTKGAIDEAAPFLAQPRLWGYDIRRHVDDQQYAHRIGFSHKDDVHFQATERIYQRYRSRQPLAHSLLLPFHLMASAPAHDHFNRLRAAWNAIDLSEFHGDQENPEILATHEERIRHCLSTSDPKYIEISQTADGVTVHIAPPPEDEPKARALTLQHELLEEASRLANWVIATREQGHVSQGLSIEDAIALAKSLSETLHPSKNSGFDLAKRIGGAGIVGTAAVTAQHGSDTLIADHREWIEELLLGGATVHRELFEDGLIVDSSILPHDLQVMGAWGLAGLSSRDLASPEIDLLVTELAAQRLHAVTEAVLQGLSWSLRPDFVRSVHIAALDSCVIDIGRWWRGDRQRQKAARRTARLRANAVKRARRFRGGENSPVLPPEPYSWQWTWTGSWPWPLRHLRMKAMRVLDWGKARLVLQQVDWSKLADTKARRSQFGNYLISLVNWTRAYSEDEDRRFDSQFPYEWGHALARELGRFASSYGSGEHWDALLQFTYHDRAEDLVGDYLDAVARELIVSERPPDCRFWAAWKPAAEWVLTNSVPPKRGHHDHLSKAVLAAGLVGPYMTPIPPAWPHLEHVLPWADRWIRTVSHLPVAVDAILAIVERMDADQRIRWFLPWLTLLTELHHSSERFWSFNGIGDKSAAMLKPLTHEGEDTRAAVRRCIGRIADAGSTVARDIVPYFAAQKPD